MARVDLDAAYAAELERAGDPHEIVLRGQVFRFPASPKLLPIAALKQVQDNPQDAEVFLLVLLDSFEQGQGERFMALEPTAIHLEALANEMAKLYGFESVGESSASDSSSPPTSESSRPSSNGTTDSTSPKHALESAP